MHRGVLGVLLRSLLVAVAIAALVPVTVVAAKDTRGSSAVRDTVVTTPPEPTEGVSANSVAVEYNPWGCYTESQNPHGSGHYPGTAAAQAKHYCSGYWGPATYSTYPTVQTLEAWLYYKWCFFALCTYNQVDHDKATAYDTNSIYLTLSANCNNGNSTTWQLKSTGTSSGWIGTQYKTYSATSVNEQTFGCGR